MKMSSLVGMAVLTLGLVSMTLAADEKPKYTIKEVMKEAMKGGLCKKVATGKATEEDKAKLVEMFKAMTQNKPPKGESESWKSKTDALLTAAKGDDGKALGKAANCMACHEVHKGKK
jgi:hypothetical protein